MLALTREVSPAIVRCELTHLARAPIDLDHARAQHRLYEDALAEAGCAIVHVDPAPDLPDAVFLEDAAVVFDELAVITRPGAPSRRGETPAVAAALGRYRPLQMIKPPATIDGGDVLVAGRDVFIGISGRTNAAGVEQMQTILRPQGYRIRAVPVRGCLHLKSAVTALAPGQLLVNPEWVARDAFPSYAFIEVAHGEPCGANIVRAGDTLIYPSAFPRTRDRLERLGFRVRTVEVGEIAKAEGAVTCCSLLVAG